MPRWPLQKKKENRISLKLVQCLVRMRLWDETAFQDVPVCLLCGQLTMGTKSYKVGGSMSAVRSEQTKRAAV